MKRQERGILFRKILIISILVLIVIGFTVPSLLDINDSSKTAPQRVCQVDADCYLTCEDKPMAVLCSQNLCWQNSCEENAIFPFGEVQQFQLDISLDEEKIDLVARADEKDLFIQFKDEVEVYTTGLTLGQVLEKVNYKLTAECLSSLISPENFCKSTEKDLLVKVNGEASYAYENYVPQAEDIIEIIYQ